MKVVLQRCAKNVGVYSRSCLRIWILCVSHIFGIYFWTIGSLLLNVVGIEVFFVCKLMRAMESF